MTAVVIDLAARRDLRKLSRDIDALHREIRERNFRGDTALANRVASLRAVEIENRHAFHLARLRPVLRELLVLHASVFDKPTDKLDAAINVAGATAAMLNWSELLDEIAARSEAARAQGYAEYERALAQYGPELFK